MKKILLLATIAMMSFAGMAQETFTREMPCKNNLQEVIATKMGTICLPYAAKPVDCSVYRLVSASAEEWIFQQVLDMEANTPYVFVVDNNTTLEASFEQCGEVIECDAPVADAAGVKDAFVGSYKDKVVRGDIFFLSYDKINSNNGKPVMGTANRAYFKADVLGGQQLSENVNLTFIPASATRIQSAERVQESETVVQRQQIGLESGRYEIGGKKVVVK